MCEKERKILNAKMVIGVIIIVFGILALVDNLGYDLKINLWDYWPLILIIIGLTLLLQPKEYRQYLTGFILLVLGGLFLAHNLIEEFDFNIGDLWPVILVIIGVKILTHGAWGSKKGVLGVNHINLSAILGGGEFNFASKELKGGKITAIMGGCTVNLRNADFKEESIVIDTFAMMGGVEFQVPQTWEVVVDGIPLLGGIENKTYQHSNNSNGKVLDKKQKRLIIKAVVIMGGIDIKN